MFLSIVTRACRRPEALRLNMSTVAAQDCDDYEHVLLIDLVGRHNGDPVLWANAQLERYKHVPQGEYVYILDDDRYFVAFDAVSLLKRRASCGADVILVKAQTVQLDGLDHIYPEREIWKMDWEGGRRPKKWSGVGANVVVKRGVWKRHVTAYQHAPGGDWHFITSLINARCTFARLNAVIAGSDGRGCGVLFEKCDLNWFKPFVPGLEHVEDNAWRVMK